jgi:chitin disaccharide deacetylase
MLGEGLKPSPTSCVLLGFLPLVVYSISSFPIHRDTLPLTLTNRESVHGERELSQFRSETNRLLGYPPDARLLIINADDFGMCHAVNEAISQTLIEGVVCSTSLMTPWPWALHAMRWLRENSDTSFAVHLTVICDMEDYNFRPLTSVERVPSLVDERGYFYSIKRIPEFVANAKLDELEIEFRAQIEAALAAKLKPTHLDWHCLNHGGRADIFDLTLGLAREYGLALRVSDRPLVESLQSQGLPTAEYDFLDSYRLDTTDKPARYAQMLRSLPVGLSEWAIHPGLGNSELQALEPASWRVRQTDYEFAMSAEARDIIEQEGITLFSYKPLQQIWQSR